MRIWILAVFLTACTTTNAKTQEPVATTGAPVLTAPTETAGSATSTTVRPETTTTDSKAETTSTPTTSTPTTSAPATITPTNQLNTGACPSPVENAQGPSVTAETILQTGELTVRAAIYPHPDYQGEPWSQWGRGVLTHDGRFLSAIGDHRGRDGNSYFYEFDPASSRLTLVGDVLSVVDHRRGDWGYGKIHGALVRDGCLVYAATYWGNRSGIEYGGTYQGDHLLRWDPANHQIESLGVPVEHQGIPSLAGFDGGDVLFGEALQPDSRAHTFFVYDVAADRLVFTSSETRHVGFRDVMVGADGEAYFSAGDGRLMAHRPGSHSVDVHPHRLPGPWLRASTEPDRHGTVFGVTRHPERLFAMEQSGEFRDFGPVPGYVASIALDVERERLYYVPHAHGQAWRDGAPLVAVDTRTGGQEILVRLEDAAEEHLGLRLGGTYNVVYDSSSRRLYMGMNAGPLAKQDEGFGEVVLLVIEWP